jgi:hypothetical protein
MRSLCNYSVKNYTKICDIVYKRDVPSFQCEAILDQSKSTEEIDCPILTLINSYVPAFTPRLHCIEAALQLSENIALLALLHIYMCHPRRVPS